MNIIYIWVGVIFGILFLFSLWIQYMMFKSIEKRMTRNMILAIEKLEWADKNLDDKTKEEIEDE